ncbi:MAG: hypothetical protein GY790_02780 [Bacteroidetes bacterium]|nr:hypothetical protein [Bacteroidota bacterium]
MIRTLIASVIIIILVKPGHGQDIYYYGANNRPVVAEEEAVMLKRLNQKSENKYVLETRIKRNNAWKEEDRQKIRIDKDGRLRISTSGERFFPKIVFREITSLEPGLYSFEETAKGQKTRTGTSTKYLPLLLEGKVTEYHPNGNQKSVSLFQNNQLISNQNWMPDGNPYIDSIFFSTDKEPVFQPGVAYFNSSLIKQIAKSGINLEEYDDEIVIGWVVMETGVMNGVIPLKGKSQHLNKILADIIAGIPGEWEPAILDGKPVRYFMSIPLNISHNHANFQDIEFSQGMLHYNRY